MSQILQIDNFDLFYKVVREICKYNYGKPQKTYPRFVSFQNSDKFFPPDSVLIAGSKAIRKYWNDKNLRKRKGLN